MILPSAQFGPNKPDLENMVYSQPHKDPYLGAQAWGRERSRSSASSWEGTCKNWAFCAEFLNFGMVVGMGIRFSKTIANDMGAPPSGLFAQNPKFKMSVNG